MSLLEIAANGMTALSILLAGRNSVHTWWTGITGCVMFAFLFYATSLYADVVLQLFFVVTSVLFLYAAYWINAVISWRWWQRHAAEPATAIL